MAVSSEQHGIFWEVGSIEPSFRKMPCCSEETATPRPTKMPSKRLQMPPAPSEQSPDKTILNRGLDASFSMGYIFCAVFRASVLLHMISSNILFL